MQTIGESAFEYCENLQKITFTKDSQLKEIGKRVFAGFWNASKLIEVHIPASVQVIGEGAFSFCNNL